MLEKSTKMKKHLTIILLGLAFLGSCNVKSPTLIDSSSIKEDGVELNFIENPKSIEVNQEYKLDISHSGHDKIDLIVTVNNGSIKRSNTDQNTEAIYILKPSKTGELNIVIYARKEGAMIE